MTDLELEQLLGDLESDRVERKESGAKEEEIRQAICAFANDLPDHRQPGVIFVGVKDKGGHSGLAITDELLRKLADLRSDGHTLPIPAMTVQKWQLSVGEVAVIEVRPADAPPVRFKGRIWIRVGPRRAVASAQEERILSEKRRFRDLPYDLHPISFARLEDLALDFFERTYLPSAIASDVLAENQRSLEQQLVSMRCLSPESPPVPTVLGALLAANDVGRLLPGAYVQFLKIDGTELTDPITDRLEIVAAVPDLIRRLEEKLESHNRISVEFRETQREKRHALYPRLAYEQLFRNAVLHRTYEGTHSPIRVTWYRDRIEMLSPSGPFGRATFKSLAWAFCSRRRS